MTLWLDAQLSPMVASFINDRMGIKCVAVRELGLRDASDKEIFLAAREAHAVVVTKDSDFIDLLTACVLKP
jgi:predicted nuclease of predicted toxin-antitoxin system